MTTTVVQTNPQVPASAHVSCDMVAHLGALADAGERLDALVGADVRAASASSIYEGNAWRVAARRLDELATGRPDVAAASRAVQVALRAVEASSPRLMAACAAGPLDPAVRADVVRARHAAQHAIDWIPPLRPPPGAPAGHASPVQRLARAVTWGLSPGEARRWLAHARAQAARAVGGKQGVPVRPASGLDAAAKPAGGPAEQPAVRR